jgi:hypothetical protein
LHYCRGSVILKYEVRKMDRYKEIRKKMIDKSITWDFIIENSKNYKSSWGIRLAIKNNQKKAIDEVESILAHA